MPPVNDNFANRISIVPDSIDISATLSGTNVGATGEPGEPNHAGVNFGGDVNSVWYTFTSPVSGPITINTLGSNYDTSLAVYTGSAVNGLTPIAGNDDFFGLQSRVQFDATAGTSYQIAVDGFSASTGSIVLNLASLRTGTAGNDNLNGSSGINWIDGGTGDDNINGNGGNDILFGGDGNDTIAGGSGNDFIDGGSDNDTIYGNGGNDTLLGGDGDDAIYGASGNDVIVGGSGNDTIYGNGGSDFIDGGDGNNLIYGGAETDIILTGSGNDTIYANGGDDFIYTGSGLDTVWLGGGSATVFLETGDGFDTINNFQLGQTRFQLDFGLTANSLSFTDSADGVRISAGGDLLAVVSWNQASTFEASRDSIFVEFG